MTVKIQRIGTAADRKQVYERMKAAAKGDIVGVKPSVKRKAEAKETNEK